MALEKFADIDELNSRVADTELEEDGGSDVDFVTLLAVARKSLIWVILLVLLGLTASYLFLRYTKPVYKSSSIIKIDEQSQAGALGLGGPLGDAAGTQQTLVSLSGEVELIKSDLIYENLKRRLNLNVSYYALGNVLSEELYNNSPFKVTYDIKDPGFYNKNFNVDFLDENRFRLSYQVGEEEISGEYRFGEKIDKKEISLTLYPNNNFGEGTLDGKYYFVINSDGALNAYLNQNLSVEIVNPDAHTVGIFFTDFNPAKARDIVNKIDSAYLEQKIRQKNLATSQIEQFLNEQLKETQDNLANSEGKMENFVRENKTYDVKADVSTQISKLEELGKERLELSMQVSLLRDVAQLINNDSELDQVIPSLKAVEDQELSQRIAELSDMQLYYKLLLRSYKPETEAVKRAQKEISLTKEAASKLLDQNIGLLEKEIATINSNMGAIEGKLQVMPQKETERARLARVFGLYEKYYLSLMDKKVEYGISKAGTVADFQILSPASLPGAPISPDRMIVYAIGLASGLMLGIGLIAGRYFMHNTVTSVAEIERNTKAAVLGVVPHYTREKLPVSKLIVDKNPKSAISESIRSIRTNLEFINSSAKKKRLISVTSTISGEGKTFVAVNLGGIIALSDQKVIILDLDLRKPKVHLAFGTENITGISTILIGKYTVQECIQQSTIPNLHFISAGPTPPNPSELILNARFDEMLEELYQLYDVVIVDTPPVGLVTDGILVMRKADVPIYIVRADYSKKSFLKNINKIMKTNNFTRLTVILNDAKGMAAGYGYGYGYGYGNSYYDDEVRESTWKRFRRAFM